MVTSGGNISYGKRTPIGGRDEGYSCYVFKGGEAARKGGSREWRAKIYKHCRRVRKAVNTVHVPIYKLFPWAWEDLQARRDMWDLKTRNKKEGTKETLDPLDGTPLHHLNTTCKKSSQGNGPTFGALGHSDDDAPLEDLGGGESNKGKRGSDTVPTKTMYALGLWFPIGYVGKACFFFADYNLKIRLDRPLAMLWSATYVHGTFGPSTPRWCDVIGTSLEVSRRTTNYKKARMANNVG